ncbi:MFS transporter [Paenibacillus hamazuiensis]|uniref:MFS transporter n=1 Tax=Paenibacillus hamazuiensis TaxID=2936508 RepID=UPI00200EF81A|nr:MFS transporter [Paenibacillus hamazuiensis]
MINVGTSGLKSVDTKTNKRFILFLLGITSLVNGFAQFFYNPILPLVQAEFKTTLYWVNFTVTMFTVSMAIMQVVFGSMADRKGRRRALLIGVFLFVLGSFGAAFAKSILVLLIARVVQGMGAAAVPVVAAAVIGDLFEGQERTKAMGTYQVIMALTPAIGPLIGGIVGGKFGVFGVFLFLAIAGIIILMANALWLGESKPPLESATAKFSIRSFTIFWVHRKSRAIMLIGFVQAFASTIVLVFIPNILQHYFNASPEITGASFLFMSLCFILSLKVGERLQLAWGTERSFILGCWLNAMSLVFFGLFIWISMPLAIVLFCWFGATYGISFPPPLTMLTELFDEERAVAVSLYNLCRNAGVAVGPIVGAMLYSTHSDLILFGAAAAVYGLAIAISRNLL